MNHDKRRPAKSKTKDEFLGRHVRHGKRKKWLKWTFPGDKDPRPSLYRVLKILAGDDLGIVDCLLSFERQAITYPDTLGEALAEDGSIRAIQTQLISTMRLVAEQWIDSGKDSANAGIDAPDKRSVEFAPSEDSPTIHQRLTARLFDRHPRFMQITSKGKLGISDRLPRIMPRVPDYVYDRISIEDWGVRLALYFFVQFLDSPFSLHLNRCDDCGVYFAYARARLVAVKNGVHCDRCKLSDSVKRTKARRGDLTSRMIEVAATAFIEWKKSNSTPDQIAWILEQVNKELAGELKKLKSKRWTTTHWNEILEAVERRKNAKG